MKELILDLRDIDYNESPESWADSNERNVLENTMLDYCGKVIRIKITETAPSMLSKGYRG